MWLFCKDFRVVRLLTLYLTVLGILTYWALNSNVSILRGLFCLFKVLFFIFQSSSQRWKSYFKIAQTYSHTQKHTHTLTDTKHKDKHTQTHTHKHTHTHPHTDKHTHTHTNTDLHTDTHTHPHTDIHLLT